MTTPVFVYHTLQYGYPLYQSTSRHLGKPAGRYRSVETYPMSVSTKAICHNPACGFDHRLCAMIDDPGRGFQVEGDLYELDEEQLRLLDADEYHFPGEPDEHQGSFRRKIEVEPLEGGVPLTVDTHFNNHEPEGFYEWIAEGGGELIPLYTKEMAQQIPKSCCVESPGHEGPHRVPEYEHGEDDE